MGQISCGGGGGMKCEKNHVLIVYHKQVVKHSKGTRKFIIAWLVHQMLKRCLSLRMRVGIYKSKICDTVRVSIGNSLILLALKMRLTKFYACVMLDDKLLLMS